MGARRPTCFIARRLLAGVRDALGLDASEFLGTSPRGPLGVSRKLLRALTARPVGLDTPSLVDALLPGACFFVTSDLLARLLLCGLYPGLFPRRAFALLSLQISA